MPVKVPDDLLALWGQWLVATARFAGALAVSPALSVPQVPPLARASVAFGAGLVGLAVVPPLPVSAPASLLPLLVREVLVGMLIGWAFAAFVWLWEWVGELADWQVGFGFAALVDPVMGTRVAIIARAATLLAGALFFALGGHHLLLRTVAESYRWLPVSAQGQVTPQLGALGVDLLAKGFVAALPLIVPTLAVLLLADLVLGLVGRAAPQLAVLLWGMPVRVIACLFVTAAALVVMPTLSQRLLHHLVATAGALVGALR